ncbi:MAG: cytochrome c-type biogenesis CcmF C-terminal domain-containing protein, partial [Oceanisphaera sp.]|nr:cytochrome c-type biogenesis CcmF C-terminal domain-containing protein [Oceanisphaera sp.]
DGANYEGFKGVIAVSKNGRELPKLHAEKRLYLVQRMPMTEAAIDAGFTRDLYAALGEELDDGSWAVRLYYKPFIRWIWFGAVLMAIAGVVSMVDKRYRFGGKAKQEAA